MHPAQPVHLSSPSTLVVVCGAPSSRCPTRGKLRWRFFRSRGGALSCVAEGAAAASVFSNNRHLRMFFAESPNFWNSAFASCLYVYLYPRSQQFWLFISVAVDVLDPPRAKYGLDRARLARHASGVDTPVLASCDSLASSDKCFATQARSSGGMAEVTLAKGKALLVVGGWTCDTSQTCGCFARLMHLLL